MHPGLESVTFHNRHNNTILTESFAFDGGLGQHHFSDKEVKMAEDDKWRRGSRTAVVLFY